MSSTILPLDQGHLKSPYDCSTGLDKSTTPLPRLSYADIVRGTLDQLKNLNQSPIRPINPSSDFILFNSEFFEVRKTPHKGFSVFATCDIDKGTIIHTEKALMKAEDSTVYYNFGKLSDQQKNEYLSLMGWEELGPRPMAIFKTNRFQITRNIGGIFPRSSRFNHLCHPYATCTYKFIEAEDTLVITTIKTIAKGEEMSISYTNAPSTLPENYGFDCDCPSCSSFHYIVRQNYL